MPKKPKLKTETTSVEQFDCNSDAGEGHQIKCPNCGQTVQFATFQWWRSDCECGEWYLEQKAVLEPKE